MQVMWAISQFKKTPAWVVIGYV